jgi:ribosomal protein L40E
MTKEERIQRRKIELDLLKSKASNINNEANILKNESVKSQIQDLMEEIDYLLPAVDLEDYHFDTDLLKELDGLGLDLEKEDESQTNIRIENIKSLLKQRKEALKVSQRINSNKDAQNRISDYKICDQCGAKYPQTLNKCPNCKTKSNKKSALLIALAIALVCVIGAGIFVFKNSSSSLSTSEKAMVIACEEVKDTLLNPDSVIWYEGKIYEKDDEQYVYIHYGAQNKMGGITESEALLILKNGEVYKVVDTEDLDDVSYQEAQDLLYTIKSGEDIDMDTVNEHVK